MQVNVFLEDTITEHALDADLREVFGDDDGEYYQALDELNRVGRYWVGGGAAPLFYVTRAR